MYINIQLISRIKPTVTPSSHVSCIHHCMCYRMCCCMHRLAYHSGGGGVCPPAGRLHASVVMSIVPQSLHLLSQAASDPRHTTFFASMCFRNCGLTMYAQTLLGCMRCRTIPCAKNSRGSKHSGYQITQKSM